VYKKVNSLTPTGVKGGPLTATEAAKLAEHESIIDRHIQEFYQVGNALLEIRDGHLYRSTHDRFDDYCRQRWGMSKTHANRLVQSAEVIEDLGPVSVKLPETERQARPLAKLPREERKAAWKEAVETAPEGKVTTKHVEKVAAKAIPPKPRPAPKPAPVVPEPPSEPADIAAQRAAGIIPEGVAVLVEEPAPISHQDVDEPDDVMAEQSDAEYLAECPIRGKLSDYCRKIFDRDALLFRSLTPHRLKFHHHAKRALNADRRQGRTGMYHSYVSGFLRKQHPRHWLLCGDCKGSGQVVLVGECPNCHGMGYKVR
jgi:hypothetical protein